MEIKKIASMATLYVFCSLTSIGQALESCNQNQNRNYVLNQNKPNKEFTFKCQGEDGEINEVILTYLGYLTSKTTKYKIVRSTWIHGQSHSGTNRILVFDASNAILGNFYVTGIDDLPEKIESNQLVFLNTTKEDCDKSVSTRISFQNGIPKEFFLKCQENMGDFYSFSTLE